MEEESILAQGLAAGWRTTFANAYPRRYVESSLKRRPAAPPLAARGAGLLSRHEEDLARGEAIVEGLPIHGGDGVTITDETSIDISTEKEAELLLFDLP